MVIAVYHLVECCPSYIILWCPNVEYCRGIPRNPSVNCKFSWYFNPTTTVTWLKTKYINERPNGVENQWNNTAVDNQLCNGNRIGPNNNDVNNTSNIIRNQDGNDNADSNANQSANNNSRANHIVWDHQHVLCFSSHLIL